MEGSSWTSYPKIYALGHAAIDGIFSEDVLIEEKIDGSQFSAGVFDGELRCRSKGAVLNIIAPEALFIKAVAEMQKAACLMKDGWTYRFEYLAKPKHNTLAYNRHPSNYLIGLDINTGHERYLPYGEKVAEFDRIGFETTPRLHEGKVDSPEFVRELLGRESCLGGQKIEGVVVKNYQRFSKDGKAMLGKFVSEEFKETHSKTWREENPGQNDVIQRIIEEYTTPARWNKAVFRLRDEGKLEGSPRDIGLLMKEVPDDVLAECRTEIMERLFKYGWEKIRRGIVKGLPQHYKEQLLKQSFETVEVA